MNYHHLTRQAQANAIEEVNRRWPVTIREANLIDYLNLLTFTPEGFII